jgi:chitodextrinase
MQKETDAWLLHASNNTGDLRPAAGGTYAGTVGLISAPSAIPTSVWTHLAQTYDGTTLRLYVNGTQVASAPHAGALQVTASPLSIGGSLAYGEFFQGRIDDARVYNRALSPAEIQADMTTPIGGGSGDSQPPTAPASLAATPASATQINLSWGASTDNVGVTQYLVERCQGAGCSSFAVIATPTTTNYGDTGLTGATSYSYRVRARDAAANLSPYSNIATASTTSDVNPPTVTITSPGGSAQLTGNATLTATAIDNESGVGGVQFQVDGVNVGPMITTPPYTTTFNTALLANGAHAIGAYAWDGSRNIGNAPVVNVTFSNGAPGNPAQTGLWTGPFTFPLVTVHSNLMPNGKALFHDGQFRGNDARVWDPVTGVFTSVTSADNIFCTGDATLADGRLLITGGHVSDDVGLPDTNYFNPTTQTWTPGPAMAFQRWYPTATTLPDGRVFIISGESTCAGCLVDVPEILNPVTNTVTQLNSSRWTVPYYPHVFVLTDGRLFVSSTSQAAIGSRTFDLNTLAWTDVDPSVKDGGSAVMYLPNKILKTGTATLPLTTTDPAAKTAYVIDMNAPNPTWRTVQSMAFARAFHTLTSLPDGTVLVTGGGRTVNREDQSTAVKQAELWDPNSETWTTLASEQVGRLYHSTAVLMQDGRVLISGGGRFSDSPQPSDMENAEWFAPPYLFKGPRPVITSAPTTLSYGAQFTVQTPDAARIAKVSLVRLANVTHTINMGQRFLPLTFTQGAGSLTVTAPPNANYATPGYYMLFIVDTNGVPSVAPIVKF